MENRIIVLQHEVEIKKRFNRVIDTKDIEKSIIEGWINGTLREEDSECDVSIGTWEIIDYKEEVEKWKEIAQDMYEWLDAYMQTSPTIDKSHPVHGLIERYEEMIKQTKG